MTDVSPRFSLDRLSAVMIVVVSLTLAGGFLLLSAAESLTLVDGAVEWQAESPLRAVVQLLCLNYQFPTIHAGDVKGFVLGTGTAVAMVALGLAMIDRARNPLESAECPPAADYAPSVVEEHRRFPPLVAAQFLALLYLLWSFASVRWSQAPDISVAGSALLAIQLFWSIALAQSISTQGVRYAIRTLLVITSITSIVAIWYYYGRNPTLRAKFPFGNPTFLSACLIPGITLGLAWVCHALRRNRANTDKTFGKSLIFWLLMAVTAAATGFWAFRLADSRGAQVGLTAALCTCIIFALRGRKRIGMLMLAAVLGAALTFYYFDSAQASLSGRGNTLRLRGYSWSYALRLFQERPITGHGQGGYTLLGDSFVPNDILNDPLVFDGRIDHAHNEWLEVLADLGAVGAVLVLAVLALTLIGLNNALRNASGEHRWCLIGIAGSLAGLAVSECAGVGLRVSEVPVVFYTILGLAWGAGMRESARLPMWCAAVPWRGVGLGVASVIAGVAAMVVSRIDFQAARTSFEAQRLVASSDLDKALETVDRGVWRLSPQRSLVGRFQTAECYVLWGERAIARATDRDQRARASQPVDGRMMELAHADIALAEEALRTGGHMLKGLIERSPGYINSGLLDSRIQLVRAQAALIRSDFDSSEASRKSAVAGLERELLRQPFRSSLAIAYSRFALPEIGLNKVLTVFARPLRYEPMTEETADSLRTLAESTKTKEMLARSLELARAGRAPETTGEPVIDAAWIPEMLRMSAALHQISGEYEAAAADLLEAGQRYELLGPPPPMGEAASHLERAEALFLANPDDTGSALKEAARAVELAPHSRLGRELQSLARDRLIQYYLAADDEAEARRLLREDAPPRVTNEVLNMELGVRLRQLSGTILLQRREAMVLRKPADVLVPRLERWLKRAIELNPEDVAARFLAADLALHSNRDVDAANHLRDAIQAGLNPADAARFLQMALEREPDSQALQLLARELQQARSLASERKEP